MKNKEAKNKKADSRLLTPFFFAILGVIGVAVAISMISYFSASADVRIHEAKAMHDKLVNAVIDNGYLDKEVANGNFANIMKNAGISQDVVEKSGYFYFNVTVWKGDKAIGSFTKGNLDFEIQCRLSGKKIAQCYEKEIMALDKNSMEFFRIKILTGSNQLGGMV